MPDRPDRYEQALIERIAEYDDNRTKCPYNQVHYITCVAVTDEALRLYRAIQYGEYTERGAALAEYRAKAVQHAGT